MTDVLQQALVAYDVIEAFSDGDMKCAPYLHPRSLPPLEVGDHIMLIWHRDAESYPVKIERVVESMSASREMRRGTLHVRFDVAKAYEPEQGAYIERARQRDELSAARKLQLEQSVRAHVAATIVKMAAAAPAGGPLQEVAFVKSCLIRIANDIFHES